MGPASLLGTAQIRAHLEKQGDLLTVSVLDNGMGIADHVVEAPDGQGEVVSERTDDSMDGLQMALRVGGRIKKHHVSPIGRFGFGLPQSGIALCYDTHTRVTPKPRQGRGAGWTSTFRPCSPVFRPNNPGPMLGVPTPALLPLKPCRPSGRGKTAAPWSPYEIPYKHHSSKEK